MRGKKHVRLFSKTRTWILKNMYVFFWTVNIGKLFVFLYCNQIRKVTHVHEAMWRYVGRKRSTAYCRTDPCLAKIIRTNQPGFPVRIGGELETLDKSTISRSLALLLEHHAIHSFEDGSGSIKYEICQSRSETCPVGDRHIHFFCEVCRKTSCLNNIKIPVAQLPEGYIMDTINYTVKGVCPLCNKRRSQKPW